MHNHASRFSLLARTALFVAAAHLSAAALRAAPHNTYGGPFPHAHTHALAQHRS